MTAPKRPRQTAVPLTLSTSELLANIKRAEEITAQRSSSRRGTAMKINASALKPAETNPFDQPERPMTKAEREAATRKASYLAGNTTPSAVDLSVKDMPGPLLLQVQEIDPFDGDPRLFGNEAEADIEVSLRASGFHDALVVTRRPGSERYMLAAGSNTTLRILKRLDAESSDERFRWVNCIYQPYQADTKLLAQHLGENLNRGDMRFWEIARGMTKLLADIEAERQNITPGTKPLALREQVDALQAEGLRANKSDIALWRFAVSRLGPLGAAVRHLTNRAVRDHIQPRTSALIALGAKFNIDEETFWQQIAQALLQQYGEELEQLDASEATFDAQSVCDRLDWAFAEYVAEPLDSVRQMASLLKKSPRLALADLRMPSPSLIVGSRAPALDDAPPESSEAPPSASSASATQSPLPIGPGQVRGAGATPSTAPPVHARPRSEAPPPHPAAQPQPTSNGPLFADAADTEDPLQRLHAAVQQLLAVAGLSDTLRWRDEMPLGFYIEMPDRQLHARRKVTLGSPEFQARAVKTVIWWSLAAMNGQFRNGCVPYIDHASIFFRHNSVEAEESLLAGTDIDEQPPQDDELLMYRLTPGPSQMHEAMRHLRQVEELAAQLFEHQPDRWRRMLEVQRNDPV